MLGLALIDECLKNNTHIVALIRNNSTKSGLLPKSKFITTISCDISELKCIKPDIAHGFDVFYHFAWNCPTKADRNNIVMQSQNINYTLDALKLAHQLGSNRFIGAGSQAEFGRVSGIITPDMIASPENAYGIAKYASGMLSSLLAKQLGIDFIWPRIFSVYGAHNSFSTMIMYCIQSLLKGIRPSFTPCEQKWDYLHCSDAAKAMYLLGKYGKSHESYNIGSGITRPLSEFIYIIRDAIDPNSSLGIGDNPYSPNEVMNLNPDITNLKNDTGFEPSISFEEGIINTINWCKDVENEDY